MGSVSHKERQEQDKLREEQNNAAMNKLLSQLFSNPSSTCSRAESRRKLYKSELAELNDNRVRL